LRTSTQALKVDGPTANILVRYSLILGTPFFVTSAYTMQDCQTNHHGGLTFAEGLGFHSSLCADEVWFQLQTWLPPAKTAGRRLTWLNRRSSSTRHRCSPP
jgi:hypothetical protein